MATNYEMIEELAMMVGYEFDGTNLKTFAEWKKEGYSVRKGEKACMKLELWKPFTAKVKNEETGEYEKDEKGNIKTETRFKLVPSSLFSIEQVDKKGEPTQKAEIIQMTVEVEVKEEAKEVEPVEVVETVEVAEASEAVEMTIRFEESEVTEEDVKKAEFARKMATARQAVQCDYKEVDRYVIKEEYVISSNEFYDLCNNLCLHNDIFEGFRGGTFSTTDPTDENDTRRWFELTEEERKQWQKGAYRACMKVSSKGSKFSLIIDPQGYTYARYVAVEYK